MISPYPVRRCLKRMKWSRKIVCTTHISIFEIFDNSRRKNVLLNQSLRDACILKLSGWNANQRLFLGESATNECTMDRKDRSARIGVTLHEYKSSKRSKRCLILPVYTVDGFYIWNIIQGSYT